MIGTASARGDMRVDGYIVRGDATLFDGTMVEAGQASVALRLNKGVDVKLSTSARGTLHRDRLVLQRGSSEWAGSTSFLVEANGLRVTASGANSRGVVSISTANTVEVSALAGELRVTDSQGLHLASVRPGNAVAFGAPQTWGKGAIPMTLFGTLTKVDGRYYLVLPKPDLGVTYELKGANLDKFVGKVIQIKGTANIGMTAAAAGTTHVIVVLGASEILPIGMPVLEGVLIGTAAAGGATALGAGIFVAAQASTPASR